MSDQEPTRKIRVSRGDGDGGWAHYVYVKKEESDRSIGSISPEEFRQQHRPL